ncbi:unnamed protein product [Didymodactylos carnosus]|uniref:Uncharacterized protein n=1 Tax=Didymodactylos carnosus TaxID=1234261 RepID=A0A815E3W5_9BILA|nr:unnamed protein product [Didymodactylos carnosus]CAF1307189.1 unnamed protein product [Didymodactylos carnosus]CAF3815878.1 unnamed protein product [Didymodactylos carnosus]CAF4141288.1 unnamed protein product [Didymodactylos carnosus]
MLINSGASLTLIKSNLFHLPYYIRQSARYPSSKFQIHLADKSCLYVQKSLLLPITIANRTKKHIVYVVPKLWRPCIIGNDFIQRHNLQIDGGHQRIYFKELVVKNPITPNLDPIREKEEEYVLLASERIKIPSYHAVNIQVQPDKEVVSTEEEPSEYEVTTIKLTPCVANGVIKPQKSMNVQVANLTKKTIIIHPGQALASMTRLNEAQSNVLHQIEKTQQEGTSSNRE